MEYLLGALKDKIDERDYKIAKFLAPSAPPSVCDKRHLMLPARNQGQEGTCVAFAACGAKQSEEPNPIYLSPRFLYDRIAQPGGGAYPRDAMKVLLEVGVPPENCQPYEANKRIEPCAKALELAKSNKIKAYARISTLEELKQTLFQYNPFMIAVGVTRNWFNVGSNGIIADGGDIIGYHAIAFVGYDDNLERITIYNSWGNWGERGYGYIGYDMMKRILTDAYSFVDVPEQEEEGYVLPRKETFWQRLRRFFSSLR